MPKRFTDTDKWKKPFIRSLKAPYKLLWLYILDECDHAGIWQVDFDVARIKIGEKVNEVDAAKCLSSKIIKFAGGEKWFIPDFIEFQYGPLNPENRAHKSVLNILDKYNLSLENKPLISPLRGAKDKDMDKEQDTDMEPDQEPPRAEFDRSEAARKIKETAEQLILVLPWPTDKFKEAWDEWLEYKKREHRFTYKTIKSEQATLNKLYEDVKGSEAEAIATIKRGIAATWEGLFPDKKPTYGQPKYSKDKYESAVNQVFGSQP